MDIGSHLFPPSPPPAFAKGEILFSQSIQQTNLLRTLTMVLSSVDLASLWNVMMTEVVGRCLLQLSDLQALLLVSGTSLLLEILSLAS